MKTQSKKKSVLRNKAYYLGVVSKKGKKSFYMRHIFQSSTDVPLTQIFQSSSAVDAAGVEGKKTYSLLMLSITVHRSQKNIQLSRLCILDHKKKRRR